MDGREMRVVEPLKLEDLTIEVRQLPGLLRVEWTGKSTHKEPGRVLKPWFDQLLDEAQRSRAALSLHFERLTQFNSSTIAAVIQLINAAQQRHVHLALHYDGSLRWQTLSFDALKRAIEPFQSNAAGTVEFVAVGQA